MATLDRPTPPRDLEVKRTDPVYMAHAYLTKVPVPAITPFIEAFTKQGDTVLDPFAGSGMTGVAAAILGRRARLFDISVLGRHIGQNYLNLVPEHDLRAAAIAVLERAMTSLGDVYAVECSRCHASAQLVKTTWSKIFACRSCDMPVNFYRALEAANWKKSTMRCPHCEAPFPTRGTVIDEEPALDSLSCTCSRVQFEQPAQKSLLTPKVDGLRWPDLEIARHRQMFLASALERNRLTNTADFFSPRNLAVLAAIKREIDGITSQDVRRKLTFVFTSILTRASKRYQWSRQRPLNAANATYYVAPVFYEWNVFDLFRRKVDAALRADEWIQQRRGAGTLLALRDEIDVSYELASAEHIPLPDESVDYVFTDPPFGSNIFYSDMSLFQEAWLDELTDDRNEAVIDRVETGQGRSSDRYEAILTDALRECRRVLKPGGRVSMVFGNSVGAIWALLNRAITAAGLVIEPDLLATLDKGQRSVKGLASGFEHVATVDLVITMRASEGDTTTGSLFDREELESTIVRILEEGHEVSPSRLYGEVIREGMSRNWDLGAIDLRHVAEIVQRGGLAIDRQSGRIRNGDHA